MLLNVVYICEIRLKPMTHRRIYMKTKHIKMLYIVVYATLDSNSSLIVGYTWRRSIPKCFLLLEMRLQIQIYHSLLDTHEARTRRKRRHEWTQDLYFCANNSKKWGPELVKRGPERTQDLYSGRYNEKGRSWVSEKRSRADSGPLFWTLQWKREVLSLWKELLRVSHFLKLLRQKPPLFLHHGEQCGWRWW